MIFTNFRDFSGFFLILFSILKPFLNKQKIKIGLILSRAPRGCDVARKATWQRHADPRSAYVACFISIVFLLL